MKNQFKELTKSVNIEHANIALKNYDAHEFIRSLREIAQIEGMADLATRTSHSRDSLYAILNPKATPRLKTLLNVLDGLDFELQVIKKEVNENT